MGISMRAVMVTDEHIRDLSKNANPHQSLINLFHKPDFCYLADYWDGIHFMLTGAREASQSPLSVLKKGDVEFSDDADFSIGYKESTHAVYSAKIAAFDAELRQITEPLLSERHNQLNSSFYPGRFWREPDADGRFFREIMAYYKRLRDIAETAAKQNMGLIFYRYEDW